MSNTFTNEAVIKISDAQVNDLFSAGCGIKEIYGWDEDMMRRALNKPLQGKISILEMNFIPDSGVWMVKFDLQKSVIWEHANAKRMQLPVAYATGGTVFIHEDGNVESSEAYYRRKMFDNDATWRLARENRVTIKVEVKGGNVPALEFGAYDIHPAFFDWSAICRRAAHVALVERLFAK